VARRHDLPCLRLPVIRAEVDARELAVRVRVHRQALDRIEQLHEHVGRPPVRGSLADHVAQQRTGLEPGQSRLRLMAARIVRGHHGADPVLRTLAGPHVHLEHVDAFYVVEGEVRFVVGPDLEVVRAGAGTFVMVPPNVVHGFDNESDTTARWLNFHAPSTGFLAWMRGDRERFDMVPPPDDGGRSADDAVIVRPGGGERYERSNRTITILGDEPQFSAFDIGFDESFDVDPHHPDDQADAFFVLEGDVAFTVGEDVVRARPGTWLSAPPGAPHGFRNGGSAWARVLNL